MLSLSKGINILQEIWILFNERIIKNDICLYFEILKRFYICKFKEIYGFFINKDIINVYKIDIKL